jgi:hypothetical protein
LPQDTEDVGDGRLRGRGSLVEQVDRAAEDDFLGVVEWGSADQGAQAISSDSRRDLTSQRSAAASGPDMRASAAPSGPASRGLMRSRPRPIRITCPPKYSVSMV